MNSGSFKNKSRIFCSSLTYRSSSHTSISFSPYNNVVMVSLIVSSPPWFFPTCRICIGGTPSVLFRGQDTRNDCIFGKTAFQLSYRYVVVSAIIKTGEASVLGKGAEHLKICQQNVNMRVTMKYRNVHEQSSGTFRISNVDHLPWSQLYV
jgi:hypothetical protein